MDEDEYIAYKEPYSIAILRSFALNLFQIYHNENKGKKLPTADVNITEIKRTCKYADLFTSNFLSKNMFKVSLKFHWIWVRGCF
jgi:hypothetical protein